MTNKVLRTIIPGFLLHLQVFLIKMQRNKRNLFKLLLCPCICTVSFALGDLYVCFVKLRLL